MAWSQVFLPSISLVREPSFKSKGFVNTFQNHSLIVILNFSIHLQLTGKMSDWGRLRSWGQEACSIIRNLGKQYRLNGCLTNWMELSWNLNMDFKGNGCLRSWEKWPCVVFPQGDVGSCWGDDWPDNQPLPWINSIDLWISLGAYRPSGAKWSDYRTDWFNHDGFSHLRSFHPGQCSNEQIQTINKPLSIGDIYRLEGITGLI